jgi:hypothetical protein
MLDIGDEDEFGRRLGTHCGSAVPRERANPAQIEATTQSLMSSVGSVQKVGGGLYQVTSDTPPVGTFNLQLWTTLSLSLLVFDSAAIA